MDEITEPTRRYLVQVWDWHEKSWKTLKEHYGPIESALSSATYENRGLTSRVVDTLDEIPDPTPCDTQGHAFPSEPDGTWSVICRDCGDVA